MVSLQRIYLLCPATVKIPPLPLIASGENSGDVLICSPLFKFFKEFFMYVLYAVVSSSDDVSDF